MAKVPNDGLGRRVRTGSLWALSGTAGGQVLSFGFGVALARLLSPNDFGLIAASLLFVEMGSTMVAHSFVSTLVRRESVSDIDLRTAFLLQLIVAAVVCVAMIVGSPAVAALMNNPELAPVLSVLSLNLIILAFRGNPTVIARRKLDFRVQTIASIIEILVFGTSAVIMALFDFGVWSLVYARLLARTVAVVQLSIAVGWSPRIGLDRGIAHKLVGMSSLFAFKEMMDDISINVGYFLVGMQLGTHFLGLYSRAHYLMSLPVTQLSESVSGVLFPAFSKIQSDDERLVNGFLKASCLLAMTVFPCLIGLQLVAYDFITLVYGEKWSPSVAPLQILCVAGLFYSVDPPAVSLINAKGYLGDDIKRKLVHITVLTGGIVFGSRWGLQGVAIAVTLSGFLYWLLLVVILQRRVRLQPLRYVSGIVPAVCGCGVMALGVFSARAILGQIDLAGGFAGLGVEVLAGGLFYAAALFGLNRLISWPMLNDSYAELERMVVKAWHALPVRG